MIGPVCTLDASRSKRYGSATEQKAPGQRFIARVEGDIRWAGLLLEGHKGTLGFEWWVACVFRSLLPPVVVGQRTNLHSF